MSETLFECKNVKLFICEAVVDDFAYLSRNGRDRCLRFRLRSRRYHQYDFGITVYDYRNQSPLVVYPFVSSRAYLKVKRGTDSHGEQFVYIVLNNPSGEDSSFVMKSVKLSCKADLFRLYERCEMTFSFRSWDLSGEKEDLWAVVLEKETNEEHDDASGIRSQEGQG